MVWIVEYLEEAEKDLKELDRSQQLQVLKSIKKVSANPLPNTEGGFGKPLEAICRLIWQGILKSSY